MSSRIGTIGVTLSLLLAAPAWAAPVEITRLADVSNQREYETLKRPIESRVLDARFTTCDAMYLANEQILSAFRFFERALVAGMPVAEDTDFFNITTVESYWYSRYNLSNLVAKSRLGVVAVHGPYVTLKALEQRDNVFYNRFRGERAPANREVLLGQLIPTYLARTGFPRRYEDASPLMLEFASGDPTFTRAVDRTDDFEGGNGRVDFEDTYLTLRWSYDRMDKTIDMGAVGQTLWKQVLWAEYFFKGKHAGGTLLGNDAEEGFRGSLLTMMAVSKMLALKSALFSDGKRLAGVNPFTYEPDDGLRYIPHRIRPELIMPGDIPPRPQWYTVRDPSSWLFDQASLLLGLTQYVNYSDPESYVHYALPDKPYPYAAVLGTNFPYDGSIMEAKWAVLARGLAEVILANMNHMHRAGAQGSLVSRWTPKGGAQPGIDTADAGLAMVALANFARHLHRNPDRAALAKELLEAEGDFLLRVQADDGGYAAAYDATTDRPTRAARTLRAQGLAIRGLLAAHEILGDERYKQAAVATYGFLNRNLWHEPTGVYCSAEGARHSEYTPIDVAAALGAVREIALATRDMAAIERYKVLHVQAVNRSGILLAEEDDTGEIDLAILNERGDGDGDGIPHFTKAGGRYGRAAVYASRIAIETP